MNWRWIALLVAGWAAAAASVGRAEDWPTWRCDPQRSGSTSEQLPETLHLQWVHRRPPLAPAWPDNPRLRFDTIYQPVVLGETMFLASSHSDSVSAIRLSDGSELWRFHADGPVRFAPACRKDSVFVASDDGYLYCLDAATGALRWKLRGGPSDRKVLGNERLISMWPARGGPVVVGDTVYFAAGIWPFMGVFVYAIDADSGKVLWVNDASGAIYIKQPHNSPAFAGLAPQGYLAASADRLLVPNGRAAAAGLDRQTGKLLYFRHAENKYTGHSEVAVVGGCFVNSGGLWRLEDGQKVHKLVPIGENVGMRYFQSSYVYYDRLTGEELAPLGAVGVLAGGVSYQSGGDLLVARDARRPITRFLRDRRGQVARQDELRVLWQLATRAKPMLRAGSRLYAAEGHHVLALDLAGCETLDKLPDDPDGLRVLFGPNRLGQPPRRSWRSTVAGTPAGMIAAAGRLFVVTREGEIHCFGERKVPEPPVVVRDLPPAAGKPQTRPAENSRAADILRATGVTEGYCLVMGLADGRLAEGLVRASSLRVVAVDADAKRVAAVRRRLDAAGLPRGRLAVIAADPRTVKLPPYLAGLMVSEDANAIGPANEAPVRALFEMLRPYGGVVCLALGDEDHGEVAERVRSARLAGAEVARLGTWTLVRRAGPLVGAGSWTGQYGSLANTCVSDDNLVKAPLGVLWFGGPSNQGILPRHGHGPPEQVLGGRLFLEGRHLLRALDVYTGRLLWQRELEDVGKNYDYTSHEPGANALGTNYAVAPGGVYVAHKRKCLLLEPGTGKTTGQFVLPGGDGDPNHAPRWGYLGVWKNLLLAGSSPMAFWSPEFHANELITVSSRTRKVRFDEKKVQTLVEAVLTWKGFEVSQPPRTVYDPPDVTEVDKGPATRPAGPVPFVVINFNKLLREGNVLARLPETVLTKVRKRDVSDMGKWDAARRRDDYYAKPKPETINDLDASIRELLASGREALDDGRDVRMLRREILQRCYRELPKAKRRPIGSYTLDHTASKEIVAMDRRTGRVLWRRPAEAAFRHNTICIGGGKLFCIDRTPAQVTSRMLRRGTRPKATDTLVAMDVRTGKVLWHTARGVFGTWLSYSADHDILIQAARPSRDMLKDESDKRIVAYRGTTGEILWDRKGEKFKYSGPCLLHGKTIIMQKEALDLLTGKDRMRANPLTGETDEWEFQRNYGCNTIIGSRHLLTFRSAAAGYYDLANDSGTGNLGGFKSGCTSNLVAADGVLNAPDYTRTCTCSYQNQSSLALIHMPEADFWTFQKLDRGKKAIRRMGVNFGAPGDRLAPSGTLWLEYPIIGGPSPKIEVEVDLADGKKARTSAVLDACFRKHPSAVRGKALRWVAASGLAASKVSVKLTSSRDAPRGYTVSLHFAEPGQAAKGERVFDVAIQGKTVLKSFDVADAAGGALRGVVKTFRAVTDGGRIRITLTPADKAGPPPILCGAEFVADDTDSP